jgi:hypothetical protein
MIAQWVPLLALLAALATAGTHLAVFIVVGARRNPAAPPAEQPRVWHHVTLDEVDRLLAAARRRRAERDALAAALRAQEDLIRTGQLDPPPAFDPQRTDRSCRIVEVPATEPTEPAEHAGPAEGGPTRPEAA